MNRSLQPNARPGRQRGAVLIVALILLVVLTMLGVTGMNTTSLEERMASNTQEVTRAFQAAETGVTVTFNDSNNFDLSGTQVVAQTSLPDHSVALARSSYQSTTAFEGWSNPPLSSGYSATSFRSAHFQILSTGTAGGQANTTVAAGAYQIAPKP